MISPIAWIIHELTKDMDHPSISAGGAAASPGKTLTKRGPSPSGAADRRDDESFFFMSYFHETIQNLDSLHS
jgi:hypothetical protein